MKITNSSIETLGGLNGAGSATGLGDSLSRAASRSGGGLTDSVNLSRAGQLLNLAKASAAPVSSAKVAGVAALVRTGQYRTDTDSVSRAVVQGHLQ